MLQARQFQIWFVTAAVFVADIAFFPFQCSIQPHNSDYHVAFFADSPYLRFSVICLRQTACAVLIQMTAHGV